MVFDLVLKLIEWSNVRNIANIKMTTNKQKVISNRQNQLARIAKALGHPIRIYVIEFLSKQTCCYSGDLTEILPIAKSTLSQHLKELKNVGLIQGEIEGTRIKYCLNQENWHIAKKVFKELF